MRENHKPIYPREIALAYSRRELEKNLHGQAERTIRKAFLYFFPELNGAGFLFDCKRAGLDIVTQRGGMIFNSSGIRLVVENYYRALVAYS